MSKSAIVSLLPKDHKLVQEEMALPPADKIFYQLKLTEEELEYPKLIARSIRDQLAEIWFTIGFEVIVVVDNTQCIEEHVCINLLQRRYGETVPITIKRPEGKFFIPYLSDLKPPRKKSGMVDYDYDSGSCSGDCSSCGG